MSISVDIHHLQGSFQIDAQFEAQRGLVALFGRSGSGKTSIINIIAGLTHPDRARVTIDGTALVDTEKRILVPRHRRRIGYVFQEGRLFPHLTVRQNLLYGRWFSALRKAGADLDDVVDMLGLAALLDRYPGRLSGGEKQRVAVGRALLSDPRLLLMDEPLSSLDEARKAEIMPYIERMRDTARVPIIYVSHSIAEVARLATSVVLISEGRVAASGPTAEIMHRLDLFPLTGRAEAGAIIDVEVLRHEAREGLTHLSARSGDWRVPSLKAAVGTRMRMRIRARDVILAREAPKDVSALNVVETTVVDIGQREAPIVDIRLDCNGDALIARISRHSAEKLALVPGAKVFALIKGVALDRRSLGGAGGRGDDHHASAGPSTIDIDGT